MFWRSEKESETKQNRDRDRDRDRDRETETHRENRGGGGDRDRDRYNEQHRMKNERPLLDLPALLHCILPACFTSAHPSRYWPQITLASTHNLITIFRILARNLRVGWSFLWFSFSPSFLSVVAFRLFWWESQELPTQIWRNALSVHYHQRFLRFWSSEKSQGKAFWRRNTSSGLE